MTIDEFVKTRVLPEFQPIVAMLRELMREMAPDATEAIRYGISAYRAGEFSPLSARPGKISPLPFPAVRSSETTTICSREREKYQNTSKSKTFKV